MIKINEHPFGSISPYGTFAFLASILGIILFAKLLKKDRNSFKLLPKFLSYVSAGVFLNGILLGYIVEILKNIYNDNSNVFITQNISFVAYGGIIGALTATYFVSYHFNADRYIVMDSISCTIPIVHGIARNSCLFSGCCYGIEYYGFLSVYYQTYDMYCFPVQIIEGSLDIILGIYLIYLYNKNNNCGSIMYIYLLIYSIYRFVLEFFRGDEVRGIFFGLSSSQYISIAVFVYAVVKIYFYNRRMRLYE